jgi:RNA polymerase sigma-32 factor
MASMAPSYGSVERLDRKYIATAMEAPILERQREADLARRWRDSGDQGALDELITAHIRLVVRIASGFRGYGLPLPDLIQEGNIGLLEAANRFDLDRQVRFSTYATWWILAAIQEYVVRNASIVRIGTTPAQKSLFFNLRRLRAKLAASSGALMTDAERQSIADALGVPLAAVERMEAHLSRPDRSLNAPVGEDEESELLDMLADPGPTPEEAVGDRLARAARSACLESALSGLSPREREIIERRFLGDESKSTLADIGERYGVTKERIRQIEGKALAKLKRALGEKPECGDLFLN